MLELVAPPKWIGETLRYRTRAREKRSFATVLDAAEVFPDGGTATVRFEKKEDASVALSVAMEMRNGHAEDRVEHGPDMRLRRLERRVVEKSDARSRHEIIEFGSNTHVIPKCTYVDTSTPFVLSGQPFDGKRRSMYLWICDRFVAKVYYESHGHHKADVPAGRIDTTEVLLYPDLNDWVKLPSIITKLSKPFLPKYHMWYEREAPHRLVRFEGPLGPPGAPEIVIELEKR